jgi:hypothetical protein
VLARAVDVFVAQRRGEAEPNALLAVFDDLGRNELGGMAKLLAALPGRRA